MDNRTAAYFRERRQISGSWSATPRIVAALIGLALGALLPGNPTPLENAVFTIVKAISGVIIVETTLSVYRWVWVAPKQMYFDALHRAELADKQREGINELLKQNDHKNQQQMIDMAKAKDVIVIRLQAQVTALTDTLNAKRKDQAFADRLTERYQFGVHEILNSASLRKRTELSQGWVNLEAAWTAEVRKMLEDYPVPNALVSHFVELQSVPGGTFHMVQSVNYQLCMFNERLTRLKHIMSIYAEISLPTP